MDLLMLILRELFEKSRFEEFKENNPDSVSFLYLIKSAKDLKNFEEIFYQTWTEILYQLPNLGCFKVFIYFIDLKENLKFLIKFEIPESTAELFKKCGLATYLNYNQLLKIEKIQVIEI